MIQIDLAATIAFRYWLTGQGSRLTRCLRFLSLFNVALGMSVTLLGIALIQGFHEALHERVLKLIPHVQVTGFTDLRDREVMRQLQTIPGVKFVLPHSLIAALLSSPERSKLLALNALPSLSIDSVYHIYPFLPALSKWDGPICVIGKGLAQHLHVKSGDWISCSYPTVADGRDRSMPLRSVSLRVAAIIDLEGEFDTQLVLTTQNVLARYFEHAQVSSGYHLYTEQPFALKAIVDAIQELRLPPSVRINTWETQHAYMFQDLSTVALLLRVIVTVITGMAAINIFYLLISVTKSWQRDAFILMGFGATAQFIRRWLHWYASFNWLAGIGGGTLLGLALIRYKGAVLNCLERWIGSPLLAREVYFIEQLPLSLGWKEVIWTLLGAQLIAEIAILASLHYLKRVTLPKFLSKDA